MIIGASKIVSKQVACDEATLEPLAQSPSRKAAKFAITTAAVPEGHLLYTKQNRLLYKATAYQTAWVATYLERQARLRKDVGKTLAITRKMGYNPVPWQQLADIHIETDPEKALQQVPSSSLRESVIFTDAARKGKLCGMEAVLFKRSGVATQHVQETVGWSATCSVLSAEIKAKQLASHRYQPLMYPPTNQIGPHRQPAGTKDGAQTQT
ncbi:Hypothetical protein D9617_61g013160 [Elsinoe fawcettii]|nr:Hypothetical protein D9617_61g013160 [Elsinoe fawcettii]